MHPFIQSLLKELADSDQIPQLNPDQWEAFLNSFVKMKPDSTMDDHFKENLRKIILNHANGSEALTLTEAVQKPKKWAWISKITVLGSMAMASFLITMQIYSPSDESFLSPTRTLPQIPVPERQYPQLPNPDRQYPQVNSSYLNQESKSREEQEVMLLPVETEDETLNQISETQLRQYPRIPTAPEENISENISTQNEKVDQEEDVNNTQASAMNDSLPAWLQTSDQNKANEGDNQGTKQVNSETSLNQANVVSSTINASNSTIKENSTTSNSQNNSTNQGQQNAGNNNTSTNTENNTNNTSSDAETSENGDQNNAQNISTDGENLVTLETQSSESQEDASENSSSNNSAENSGETMDDENINSAGGGVAGGGASISSNAGNRNGNQTTIGASSSNTTIPIPKINVEYQYNGKILMEDNEIFLSWPTQIKVYEGPVKSNNTSLHAAISIEEAVDLALKSGASYEDPEDTIYPQLGEPEIKLLPFYRESDQQLFWMNALVFPVIDWDTYPQFSVPMVVSVPLAEGVLGD